MKWYTRLTRWATRWAWRKELNALDNIAWFKELSLDEHKLQGEVILTDGMAQVIAHAFAEATFNTPNYVEYQFEPRAVKHRDQWAKTVITVKKHTGKTPHELRRIAEQERDEALKQLDELRKELHKVFPMRIVGEASAAIDDSYVMINRATVRLSCGISTRRQCAKRMKLKSRSEQFY